MNSRINRAAAAVVTMSVSMGGTAGAQCIEGDINGDGVVNGIDLAFVLQNWEQSCPTVIESVSPSEGPLAGGTQITISGEQLGGVQSVTIGGAPALDIVGINSTTVTAVTPASKLPGPKDVVITTSGGKATLTDGFSYQEEPLEWATVLETIPDPQVVTDPEWRERIAATGLPWRVRDNASQIEMLLVPPGTFEMGCSPSALHGCSQNENPVHDVTLTQPFYLGRYEVTQAQWTALMGSNPSQFQNPSSEVPADQVAQRPVERVSWNMIQPFEAKTGLRLPTEAEWEYACRAGTLTAFNLPPEGTNDDNLLGLVAWYEFNSAGQTRPVGLRVANNLGFFDMHGNVHEWVEDWYGWNYYSESPEFDPPGPEDGMQRLLRGGNWNLTSYNMKSSSRWVSLPKFDSGGFRAARNP